MVVRVGLSEAERQSSVVNAAHGHALLLKWLQPTDVAF